MKGISMMLIEIISGLIFVGLAALLYMLFATTFFGIHLAVVGNEVERHAILLENALMSSSDLVYVDDYQVHRGVFAEDKLTVANIESVLETLSYTDSVTYIMITDLKDGDTVRVVYGNKISPQAEGRIGSSGAVFRDCVGEKASEFIDDVVGLRLVHLFDVFNVQDIDSCIKSGASEAGFHRGIDLPVIIRSVAEDGSIENHPAMMSLSLFEV